MDYIIYKHNQDGIIDTIYIVYNKYSDDHIDVENIKKTYEYATVHTLYFNIHNDDTIFDLKQKIIINIDNKINFNDIYLYGVQNHDIDLIDFYNKNVNDNILIDKHLLTKSHLVFKKPLIQNEYTYQELLDIVELQYKLTPMGVILPNDISINPYYNDSSGINIQTKEENFKFIKSYNLNHDIHMYLNNDKINNLYFPNNYEENSSNNSYKEKFNLINTYFEERNFNNIINLKFKSLSVHIKNDKFYLDIDKLFKNFNCSKLIPLIKFNPGKRKERIFRLYSDNRNLTNQKIPYLSSSNIRKFIGEEKGKYQNIFVSFFIIIPTESLQTSLTITIFDKSIDIYFESQKDFELEKIKNYISEYSNNLFDEIENLKYIHYLNYKLSRFVSFDYYNCVTKNIEYKFIYNFDINTDLIFKHINKHEILYPFRVLSSKSKTYEFEYLRISRNNRYPKLKITEKTNKNLEVVVYDVDNFIYFNSINTYLSGLFEIIQKYNTDKKSSFFKLIKDVSKNYKITDKILISENQQHYEDLDDEYYSSDDDNYDKISEEYEIQDDSLDSIDNTSNQEKTPLNETKLQEKSIKSIYDSDDEDIDMGFDFKGGGGGPNTKQKHSYFIEQIKRLDPDLYELNEAVTKIQVAKTTKDKWNPYTRTCGNSEQRQPIILTENEKNNIDKNHPNSYSTALKYSSNPETKPNYYICPKFWCADNRIALNDSQVSKIDNEYVSEYCKNDKGEYSEIMYFDKNRIDDKTGDYSYYHPSFNKKSCLPCCDKKISKLTKPPSECNINTDEKQVVKPEIKKAKSSQEKVSSKKKENIELQIKINEPEYDRVNEVMIEQYKPSYIKNSESIPLQPNHWGRLNDKILNLLQIDDFESNKGFLRNGVNTENSTNNQSFIGCISILYTYSNRINKIKSIQKMKQHLIDSITIDKYSRYNNGDLIEIFHNKDDKYSLDSIDKYSNSKYYKNEYTFTKLVNSFENYKKYIMTEGIEIDYKYIWDIICEPNDKIFKNGCNLIILEIIDDSIHIVCPVNKHINMNNRFDSNKPSFIIIKKDENYEPVMYYENTNNILLLKLNFYIDDKDIGNFLQKIEKIFNQEEYCGIIKQKIDNFNIKQGYNYNTSNYIFDKLKEFKVKIVHEVLNSNLKNVGFIVNIDNSNVHIPCYPSENIGYKSFIYINDDTYVNEYILGYEYTKEMLNKIYNITDNSIFCKPINKVVTSDGKIIGIVTIMDCFIETIIEQDKNDDLEIDTSYYTISSREIINSNNVNEIILQKKPIQPKISIYDKLTNQNEIFFYFYKMIDYLLKHPSNRNEYVMIEKIIKNEIINYEIKLEKISEILKTIGENHITFEDDVDLDDLDDLDYNIEKVEDIDNISGISIPYKNLVTDEENEYNFYKKISDYLIRYNIDELFHKMPSIYLEKEYLDYHIQEDELLIFESLLNKSFFDGMKTLKLKNDKLNDTYLLSHPELNYNHPYSNKRLVKPINLNKIDDNTLSLP